MYVTVMLTVTVPSSDRHSVQINNYFLTNKILPIEAQPTISYPFPLLLNDVAGPGLVRVHIQS